MREGFARRRALRQDWQARTVRDGDCPDEIAAEDVRFWLSIPMSERAKLTWELSEELFEVAELNRKDPASGQAEKVTNERRLSRSAYRVERR